MSFTFSTDAMQDRKEEMHSLYPQILTEMINF